MRHDLLELSMTPGLAETCDAGTVLCSERRSISLMHAKALTPGDNSYFWCTIIRYFQNPGEVKVIHIRAGK